MSSVAAGGNGSGAICCPAWNCCQCLEMQQQMRQYDQSSAILTTTAAAAKVLLIGKRQKRQGKLKGNRWSKEAKGREKEGKKGKKAPNWVPASWRRGCCNNNNSLSFSFDSSHRFYLFISPSYIFTGRHCTFYCSFLHFSALYNFFILFFTTVCSLYTCCCLRFEYQHWLKFYVFLDCFIFY